MHLALRHGLACGALAYPIQVLLRCPVLSMSGVEQACVVDLKPSCHDLHAPKQPMRISCPLAGAVVVRRRRQSRCQLCCCASNLHR